jgi:hypothetical protein
MTLYFCHQALDEPLMTALILGNYKLVKSEEAGLELFDLSTDLGEEHNRIDSLPQIASKLSTAVEDFLLEAGAATESRKSQK